MKNVSSKIFLLLIFLSPLFPAQDTGRHKNVLSALDKNDSGKHEIIFNESVSEAASLFELSKKYAEENTIVSRIKARKLLRKAIWKEPDNIEFRFLYAELMEWFGRKMAFREYKKIVEIDSTNAEALYNLGRLKEEEFYEFHNSVAQEQGSPELSYEKFAEEDFAQSVKYFLKAIKYDSLNLDSYLHLGFLYEETGNYCEAVSLLKKAVDIFPEDKDSHLFLGLLRYKNSEIESAFSSFQTALILMDDGEREAYKYESAKELLEPLFAERMEEIGETETEKFIEAFWEVSDPLYLSEYNERIIEHYSRMAYANLRFKIPYSEKDGWKTDRGEMVLRYGEPHSKKRYRPWINAGGQTAMMVKTDVWFYDYMTLGFEDKYLSGEFRFSAPSSGRYFSQFGDDTHSFAQYFKKAVPQYFRPKFEGPVFDIKLSVYQFKNEKALGKTDVYVNYGIPFADSLFGKNDFQYKYDWGLFFIDEYFNRIYEERESGANLNIEEKINIKNEEPLIANFCSMPVKPDSGKLAFEIRREFDKGVSANHFGFRVKEFNNDSLDLSDILLASKINMASNGKQFLRRGNYSILPNPSNIFSEEDELFLYYEIYNLEKDKNGLSEFKQEITVKKKDGSGGIKKVFKSIAGFVGLSHEDEISLSSNYKTNERDYRIYLKLDMSGYEPGEYILEAKITDKQSGLVASRKTKIIWR